MGAAGGGVFGAGKVPEGEVRQVGPDVPEGWMGLDIGPGTAAAFADEIASAATVFWNGPMGVFEDPRFAAGTKAVADAVASTKAFVSTLTVLTLLAVHLGRLRQLSAVRAKEILRGLEALPPQIEKILGAAKASRYGGSCSGAVTDLECQFAANCRARRRFRQRPKPRARAEPACAERCPRRHLRPARPAATRDLASGCRG